jgi:3-deoxy-D-manno-octulosonic-acid transferase
LGWYDAALSARLAETPRVWVHAVSVGEVYVALKFMDEWRQLRPGVSFVMSVNTSTAHALAEQSLPPADVLVYFPLDFLPVLSRVFQVLQPSMLILTECELWPNLISVCRRRGIPVMLINGRMSERSFHGYSRFRVLFSRLLAKVDRLCVQGEGDRDRFLELGAPEGSIVITGSAKYDVALAHQGDPIKAAAILSAAGMTRDDLILLGGSTWPGEEEILLDYFIRAKSALPRLKLILVPRHAERRKEVVAAIEERGLSYVQRSRAELSPEKHEAEVLLVDTTGELRHLYALASVIFVGKSLTQHGGQNLIEPAVCGKAVVVGPNMENFLDITGEFKQAEAVIQVGSADELSRVLDELLANTLKRQGYGDRANALVSRSRGCVKLSISEAERLLDAEKRKT